MKRLAALGVVLLVVASTLFAIGSHPHGLADGIEIAGVDVSGMDQDEAQSAIEQKLSLDPVTVRAGEERLLIRPGDVDLRWETDRALEEAQASTDEATGTLSPLFGVHVDRTIAVDASFDRDQLRDLLARLASKVKRQPVDAAVSVADQGLSVTAATPGQKLEGRSLSRRVVAALLVGGGEKIKADLDKQRPHVTRGDLASQYPTYIVIDKSSFALRFYRDLELEKTYPIAVGMPGYDTPEGSFSIIDKTVDPVWTAPDAPWAGELAGQAIPGGSAENPLIARWMGVTGGVGIHGTADIASLGSAASHGCIRMDPTDVIELYDLVPLGTPVLIAA